MHSLSLLPPRGDKARKFALFLLMLGPVLCGVLAMQLGQDANWDLRNYHWYNAYALLNGRHGYDILPSQTPFFYSPMLDVPVYLLGQRMPAEWLGFTLGLVQGLNFCLLFMIAHALLVVPKSARKVLVAAALAALGMLGGGGIAQLGTTFNDNLVSIGLLTSLALILRALPYLLRWEAKQAIRAVFLYGMPLGLALGLKLTLLCFCIGMVLAWFGTGGSWSRRFMLAFAFGCGLTLGMLLTQGYWMWFLWKHYNNPIFPYFNQIFASPYGALTSARDTQFIPGGWLDTLLFPWNFTLNPKRAGEIVWQDWRILALYLLLPLCSLIAVIVGRRNDKSQLVAEPLGTRYCLWFAAISYGVWLLLFSIYRYLIPLEMLAPLLLVLTLGLLPLPPSTKWLVAAALLVVIAVGVRSGNWGRVAFSQRFIEVLAPPVPHPEETMLLMAGFEPYAHILPSFEPIMPVVRIQSNFASPREGEKGINRVIADRIALHTGRFILLIPDWQVPYGGVVQEGLSAFQLQFDPKACVLFPDNLGYRYALCAVTRLTANPPTRSR